ncbi:MAG: hypothetical protein HWN65_13995 [Candidatus Helarchaeota archaeon]|nr:hypothetical protein [Candidatus Helarchaeota archaeon]
MKASKFKFLIGICSVLLCMNLISISPSQAQASLYYFWITETGHQISAIQMTGDLDSDHIPLSEIVVSGLRNVTLFEGMNGAFLSNYTISPAFSFNALAVGNLDNDSSKEIVAGSLDGNLTIALKYDPINGNFSLLWERYYNASHVAIADVTDNSLNEVLIGDALGNLTVLHRNGTFLWSSNLPAPVINFKCLDLSQNGTIDGILVLTNNFVTFLNNTGSTEWQSEMSSKPLDGIIGDIQGNSSLEIIVKAQNYTNAFSQNGTLLWNSTSYSADSPKLILYNYVGSTNPEILISANNGSYFLNGTNGTSLKTYSTQSSISTLGISNIFGGSTDYLIMGHFDHNISFWTLNGEKLFNVPLSGVVLDIILLDMNADGIADLITATDNGTVYIIGLPLLYDFTWIFVGIGIGAAVIIASIYLVMRTKQKPPGPIPPAKIIK